MQRRKPWRPNPKLEEIAAVVARIELIPADRPLTTGEIRALDSLAARLRQRSLNDRSERLLDLLRRVSAVRTRSHDAGVPAPSAIKRTAKAGGGPGETHRELTELEAKRPLGPKDLQRLGEIVNESASRVDKGSEYRRLYERALRIQKRALRPPSQMGPTGQSRGLVQNPGLIYGGYEVLGGAPSSRRGH